MAKKKQQERIAALYYKLSRDYEFSGGRCEHSYACINYGDAACPSQIEKQSICVDDDIGRVLRKLL